MDACLQVVWSEVQPPVDILRFGVARLEALEQLGFTWNADLRKILMTGTDRDAAVARE